MGVGLFTASCFSAPWRKMTTFGEIMGMAVGGPIYLVEGGVIAPALDVATLPLDLSATAYERRLQRLWAEEMARARQSDLVTIAERMAWNIPFRADEAKSARDTMGPDGSWPDIAYDDRCTRSLWPPAKHLNRTLSLACAWRQTDDAASLDACRKALTKWRAAKCTCPNWWWPTIGVPQLLGNIALALEPVLTDEERAWFAAELVRAATAQDMTGQNLVWVKQIALMRAVLLRDAAAAENAVKVIRNQVCVSSHEGIQQDWCFHQHGHQPQFGNYGLSFICEQATNAKLFDGTFLAFDKSSIGVLRSLAENGFAWTLWNGRMDVSAMGRQLFPQAQEKKARAVLGAFDDLEACGWKRPDDLGGLRFFDRSEYAVFRTNRWMASVRASSPTVIGVETDINEDNVKGQCMADGALMTYVTGREYEDVFPLWDDWRMIPGVTGYLGKPTRRGDARNCGKGLRRVAAETGDALEMDFRREGLSVHKRWAFDGEGVTCTGDGITATDGNFDVATCVEAAHAASDAGVVYQRDDVSCFRNGPLLYTVWAPRDAIRFEVAERKGDFRDFMMSLPSTPVAGRLFSLRIMHGKLPKAAAYRYRIHLAPQEVL